MKYKISRAINNITLNGNEYILDEENNIMEFETILKAKEYLLKNGVKSFDGISFEEIKEDEEIEKRFNEIIESLSDDLFWEYVRSWFDEEHITSIMNDWDIETKEQAIKEIEELKKCGSLK